MNFSRSSGILLHPTSLPGDFGAGDFGPSALRFLERLAAAGQSVWQVLPLGPTSYGNSPYQSLSAFAMNPLFVSPERLAEGGLVDGAELDGARRPSSSRLDFGDIPAARETLLRRAFDRFRRGEGADPAALASRFDAFRESQRAWLPDYAAFVAIKRKEGGRAWTEWPRALRLRESDAVERFARGAKDEVAFVEFAQFLAFTQWSEVREKARSLGVAILGDVPIFVAADSADVWARRELFDLDDEGRPRVVAGVPPDYFSATGQLWGNPLYRWDRMAERGFDWWVDRLRAALALADRVRIDHFRGFESHWEIPAGETTAVNGRWVKGPGRALFDALSVALGPLPIVAEDLGEITPEVGELRDALDFPGMRVLQFAFSDTPREDLHAPHGYIRHLAAYTGTHDNDTTVGWFRGGAGATTRTEEEVAAERGRILRYLGTDGAEIQWDLIRLLLMSVADTAIVPMQDILGLGTEARMNTPGRLEGNWEWRMTETEDVDAPFARLAEMTRTYGRWPETAA